MCNVISNSLLKMIDAIMELYIKIYIMPTWVKNEYLAIKCTKTLHSVFTEYSLKYIISVISTLFFKYAKLYFFFTRSSFN